MDNSKLFSEITILQALNIWINGYEISPEDLLSLEIKWSFDDFFISGTLSIKDSFQLSDLDIFNGETTMKIYSKDFYGSVFTKQFVITSVTRDDFNNRFSSFSFSFVDRVYFNLVNAYISKGFTGTVTNAFTQYAIYLELAATMAQDAQVLNMETSTDVFSFVVPQDRSVFEFFNDMFKTIGFRWWQDRSYLNIKQVDINSQNPIFGITGTPAVYSNATANNDYAFKFFDYKIKYNDILTMGFAQPIQKNLKYDISTKSMDDTTENLEDIYSTLKLNSKLVGPLGLKLQHTDGEKLTKQAWLFTGNQKIDIENVYNSNNILDIVVPGNFAYSSIGKLVTVEFKGNPMIESSASSGDVFHSGKYFVQGVTDRFIGDKLIQKMRLTRIDFQQPRLL